MDGFDPLISAPSALLLVSGLMHAGEPRILRAALSLQRLVSDQQVGPLARVVPLAETTAGVLGVAASLISQNTVAAILALPVFVVYLVFAIYTGMALRHLRRTGLSAPCGCIGSSRPLSFAVTLRAFVAAAFVIAGLIVNRRLHFLGAGVVSATLMFALYWLPDVIDRRNSGLPA